MGLFKRGPRDEFVDAWGVTFINPVTRAPIQQVRVDLSTTMVTINDRFTSRPLWVRKLADLTSIQVDGNQLLALFGSRRGFQAMSFDFTPSDSDDASAAAKEIFTAYQELMVRLGRPAVAMITP